MGLYSIEIIPHLLPIPYYLFYSLIAGLALVGCDPKDGSIVEGMCPAISRDGRYLAFERIEGNNVHLGVKDLKEGGIRWIARGETVATKNENACHPAWGPDGQLVFAYANLTNTAYQRFEKRNGAADGYRVRVWNSRDDSVRDLVGGLARNYNPSFAPDGKKIYFCKQGGVSKRAKYDFRNQAIAEIDVVDPSDPLPVITALADDCGVSQPVVSPNGKFLAYAELGRSMGLWTVKIAQLDNHDRQMSVTPGNQAAYAPNWFPDGKYLAYTGFAVGDSEWCVYVINIEDGSTRRICPGEDACVAADGRTIYYCRANKIFARRLTAAELPYAGASVENIALQPEKVLFRNETAVTNQLYAGCNAKHACTSNTVHFFRYTVDWDGRNSHFLMAGGFNPIAAFWGFVIDKHPTASGREHGDEYRASAIVNTALKAGRHVFTIIFCNGAIYQSVDGCPPSPRKGDMQLGPCNGKKANYAYFPNGAQDDKVAISNLEIGIGWPKNVLAPLTGKEICK